MAVLSTTMTPSVTGSAAKEEITVIGCSGRFQDESKGSFGDVHGEAAVDAGLIQAVRFVTK